MSSGKSTLVDRLCQVSKSHPIGGKFPLSGCSLEYRFIDVQDEETDGMCCVCCTMLIMDASSMIYLLILSTGMFV